jgi:hypothetical protein
MWERHLFPKRQLAFNSTYGVTSPKIVLFRFFMIFRGFQRQILEYYGCIYNTCICCIFLLIHYSLITFHLIWHYINLWNRNIIIKRNKIKLHMYNSPTLISSMQETSLGVNGEMSTFWTREICCASGSLIAMWSNCTSRRLMHVCGTIENGHCLSSPVQYGLRHEGPYRLVLLRDFLQV